MAAVQHVVPLDDFLGDCSRKRIRGTALIIDFYIPNNAARWVGAPERCRCRINALPRHHQSVDDKCYHYRLFYGESHGTDRVVAEPLSQSVCLFDAQPGMISSVDGINHLLQQRKSPGSNIEPGLHSTTQPFDNQFGA